MRKNVLYAALLVALLLPSGGCVPDAAPSAPVSPPAASPAQTGSAPAPSPSAGREAIPFEDGQLYAAAYLGYQQADGLDYYTERYLDTDGGELPVYTISGGDFYLVIPRYSGMTLTLFVNDVETSEGRQLLLVPDCGPFVLQCNASDVFADVTLLLSRGETAAEFSPFISLMDGSLEIGEYGLDITRPGVLPSPEAGAGGEEP